MEELTVVWKKRWIYVFTPLGSHKSSSDLLFRLVYVVWSFQAGDSSATPTPALLLLVCPWPGPLCHQNSFAPCPGTCSKMTPQLQPVTSKRPPNASQVNSQSDSYNPQALTDSKRNNRTDQISQTQVSPCSFRSRDWYKAAVSYWKGSKCRRCCSKAKATLWDTEISGQRGLHPGNTSITQH